MAFVEGFGDNFNGSLVVKYSSQKWEQEKILTLFTTLKISPDREDINKNTIKFWAYLPQVQLILFITEPLTEQLASMCHRMGWSVVNTTRVRKGLPVLKDMFLYIRNNYEVTKYIGYANSDILFTKDLIHTVKLVDLEAGNQKGIFITGKRRNTLLKYIAFDEDLSLLSSISEFQYDESYALDYFIFAWGTFPWQDVPDFVVGKPGFDNWLAIKAINMNLLTVDATMTVPAIHQVLHHTNTEDGWKNNDVCMNRELVDPLIYNKGRTFCLRYFTHKRYLDNQIQEFSLYKRFTTSWECSELFRSPQYCITALNQHKKL
jgi:hypothetical protein